VLACGFLTRHVRSPDDEDIMAGLTSTTGVPLIASRASTFDPEPGARHDAGTVQADRVRPIGRTGTEHAGQRLAHVVLGMRAQLVAGRQVQPGEHHDLIARAQVLGALRDLLIEADPRPRRAFALVRRIRRGPAGPTAPTRSALPNRKSSVAGALSGFPAGI
jgi:hypothetical protein